uniref:RNA helicase n=1 Tax=Dunaliella tertiolecta TaxID=3047 RepID=A0A7S3QYI1_DUNTE|mmetsp:Transcript_26808/g.72390  ORF Transcript_26808/g.72390 Transcript_26808/m.72390 type:complete len:473 (+) Transcript_26808:93-1511(+)|eukprot:CAMPEP_0202360902 /NCGR_PEP_ID=MMETSP1126-20121109/13671_1 /ASSEMBLY_ACC=CAM_ASM_000457 /TAXON_ID=3047 /ORGANISM="Dunaliella tertiolecta, Strain CCMP1320" /LENGTH=472 /DNA_ID=CAMNT_0048954731 /DNA_START=35 /DNA_END=1453 /DNA_ORIENTATION=+
MADTDVQLFARRKGGKKRQKVLSPKPNEQPCSQQREPEQRRDEEAGPGPGSSQPQTGIAGDFKALGLTDWLVSVCKSLGMTRPTHVQQGCVPEILAGRDVIGLAQTGSGKTAAFALPILQKLAKDPYGVFALVLIPTRELAIQAEEQFRALGAGMSLKEHVIIGGVDMQAQSRALSKRPHVVIATPGRLAGLLNAEPELKAGFTHTRFVVLDEADRLLDATFQNDLKTIFEALPPGEKRQTLLFSATMTQALIKLQQKALNDAYVYQAYEGLKTADRLKENYLFIPEKVKEVYLAHILGQLASYKVRSTIIFCSTCKGCHLLHQILEELGFACAALHSGKPQRQRQAALSSFKSEAVSLLLATDVASRGLDIPTVDLVINFDLPVLARDYVHRVGRTARAGREGWSLSFVSQYDVQLVHSIEALIGHQLQEFKLDEAEVLKGITKVYSARRAAMLKIADEEKENKDKRSKKK